MGSVMTDAAETPQDRIRRLARERQARKRERSRQARKREQAGRRLAELPAEVADEIDAWLDDEQPNVVNLEGHRSDCRLVLVSYELLDGEAFDREAIVAAIQRDDVA